jgi:hypothetical protein
MGAFGYYGVGIFLKKISIFQRPAGRWKALRTGKP